MRSTQTPKNLHFWGVMSTHSTKPLCSPRAGSGDSTPEMEPLLKCWHSLQILADSSALGAEHGGENQFPTVSLYSSSFNLYLNQNKSWVTLISEVLLLKPEYPGYHSFIRLREVKFLSREQTTNKLFHLLSRLAIISATSLITPWQYQIDFYSF